METSAFVQELERGNEALYKASEMQVEAFFTSNPSTESVIRHFRGRCANEYRNMEEVAQRLLSTAQSLDPDEVRLLAKQVYDEATHVSMVAEVIERLSGARVDLNELCDEEREGGEAKGVRCLEGFPEDDLLALHTYQFIAEGRAHRVWRKMAEVITDDHIAKTYAKIAKDELFHSQIGRRGLEALAADEAAQKRVLEIADDMRHELYEVSAQNTVELPEARALCAAAYGDRYLA